MRSVFEQIHAVTSRQVLGGSGYRGGQVQRAPPMRSVHQQNVHDTRADEVTNIPRNVHGIRLRPTSDLRE